MWKQLSFVTPNDHRFFKIWDNIMQIFTQNHIVKLECPRYSIPTKWFIWWFSNTGIADKVIINNGIIIEKNANNIIVILKNGSQLINSIPLQYDEISDYQLSNQFISMIYNNKFFESQFIAIHTKYFGDIGCQIEIDKEIALNTNNYKVIQADTCVIKIYYGREDGFKFINSYVDKIKNSDLLYDEDKLINRWLYKCDIPYAIFINNIDFFIDMMRDLITATYTITYNVVHINIFNKLILPQINNVECYNDEESLREYATDILGVDIDELDNQEIYKKIINNVDFLIK